MAPTFNHEAAKAAIEDRGLTVTYVAKAIGRDRAVLSNILNGNRAGSVDLAIAIAEVVGGTAYRFLGPDDPKAATIELARRMGITPEELAS